jgi:hypothetical protein
VDDAVTPLSVDREAAAIDHNLVGVREGLARFTSEAFAKAGQLLHAFGHVIGSDRVEKRSPFGHGSDETVAVSMLRGSLPEAALRQRCIPDESSRPLATCG